MKSTNGNNTHYVHALEHYHLALPAAAFTEAHTLAGSTLKAAQPGIWHFSLPTTPQRSGWLIDAPHALGEARQLLSAKGWLYLQQTPRRKWAGLFLPGEARRFRTQRTRPPDPSAFPPRRLPPRWPPASIKAMCFHWLAWVYVLDAEFFLQQLLDTTQLD